MLQKIVASRFEQNTSRRKNERMFSSRSTGSKVPNDEWIGNAMDQSENGDGTACEVMYDIAHAVT